MAKEAASQDKSARVQWLLDNESGAIEGVAESARKKDTESLVANLVRVATTAASQVPIVGALASEGARALWASSNYAKFLDHLAALEAEDAKQEQAELIARLVLEAVQMNRPSSLAEQPEDPSVDAKYDVFFSYRTHRFESDPTVQPLLEAFEAAGIKVWIDRQGIAVGEEISKEVREALSSSRLLLAYYTDDYAESPACQWELTTAFIAGQHEGKGRGTRRTLCVVERPEDIGNVWPEALRNDSVPSSSDRAAVVAGVQKKLEQLHRPIGEVVEPRPPHWAPKAKRARALNFVGRLQELWTLHSFLHASEGNLATRRVDAPAVVSGLGGEGKSLLAAEYAHRFSAAYPGGVIWFEAGPEGSAEERVRQLVTIGDELGIDRSGIEPPYLENFIWRRLAERGPVLTVVDDVPKSWTSETFRGWRAPDSVGPTLYTTRARGKFSESDHELPLGRLTEPDALRLLTTPTVQKSQMEPLRDVRPQSPDEWEAAEKICQELSRHALAVSVTGARLRRASTSATPYAQMLARLEEPFSDHLRQIAEKLKGIHELPTKRELCVVRTFEDSLEQLSPDSLMTLQMAYFGAPDIPWPGWLLALVFARARQLDGSKSDEATDTAFLELEAASLGRQATAGSLEVHSLVAATAVLRTSDEERASLQACLLEALADGLSEAGDIREHASLQLAVEHGLRVGRAAGSPVAATVLAWCARFASERGLYGETRTLQEAVLEARRRLKGPEHPDTLTTMNDLATTLWAEGKLDEARSLQQAVLEAQRRLLSPEHPDTLTTMNNLATTLSAQGELEEARSLQQAVLKARRQVLGPEHPDTLTSMNNLATTLKAQGEPNEARSLHEAVLEVQRRLLGPEHSDTLTSMNNLATTLKAQGELNAARSLHEAVLEARRRLQGPEHSDTLTSMNNLATTLQAQGELDEARSLQQDVLKAMRRLLGPEHPGTLTTMNNLAITLWAQGKLDEARSLQQAVLEAQPRLLGPEHPDTLTSMNNLATTLWAQGEIEEARSLCEAVLDARRRVLGHGHPDTLASMNNLATTLRALGELE